MSDGPKDLATSLGPLPERALEEAVRWLCRGGIGVFPTETLAGLGGDARRPEVLTRVATLKGRAEEKRFPLLLPPQMPLAAVAVAGPTAARLADAFWPGRLTLVLEAHPSTPPAWRALDGTIAVRRSAHPVAAALARGLGGPLVATSANHGGHEAPSRVAEVAPELLAGVDFTLEDLAEWPADGAGSTIFMVTRDGGGVVLRHGAIPESALRDVLRDAIP